MYFSYILICLFKTVIPERRNRYNININLKLTVHLLYFFLNITKNL